MDILLMDQQTDHCRMQENGIMHVDILELFSQQSRQVILQDKPQQNEIKQVIT